MKVYEIISAEQLNYLRILKEVHKIYDKKSREQVCGFKPRGKKIIKADLKSWREKAIKTGGTLQASQKITKIKTPS
jgi:hypothetical protein